MHGVLSQAACAQHAPWNHCALWLATPRVQHASCCWCSGRGVKSQEVMEGCDGWRRPHPEQPFGGTDGSHPDAAPVSTAAVRMSHIQVDPISSRLSKHPEARGLLAHGPFWGGCFHTSEAAYRKRPRCSCTHRRGRVVSHPLSCSRGRYIATPSA